MLLTYKSIATHMNTYLNSFWVAQQDGIPSFCCLKLFLVNIWPFANIFSETHFTLFQLTVKYILQIRSQIKYLGKSNRSNVSLLPEHWVVIFASIQNYHATMTTMLHLGKENLAFITKRVTINFKRWHICK